MGQASSVQREPSMEEILASIRRIIEDSDVTRKGGAETGSGEAPAGHPGDATDIAAFRTGLHEPEGGNGAGQFGAASGYPPAAPAAGAADEQASPPGGYSFHPSRPVAEADGAHPADEIEMEIDIDGFEELAGAGSGGDAAPTGFADASADRRPAILSEQTGRQVAASFGELSDALAARSRKSFDQIAEEMLRPMLQDWLDNNLPHLVEKLVREEIERIARGPAQG